MMTAHGSTSTAVEAMKAGAQDYLMKPFDIDELLITVAKAFEVESLREQVDYLKGVTQNDGWQLDGFVGFAVSDEGPGISPDTMPYIYDPFFTTKEKGTGLGLSVVHRILDQHGGKISAANRRE